MNFCNRAFRAKKYLTATLFAVLSIPPITQAQTPFPNKVIKQIVPVAPGRRRRRGRAHGHGKNVAVAGNADHH